MIKEEGVAPLVGARVEIFWENDIQRVFGVAPLVGARVEIAQSKKRKKTMSVAPLVGARVEIPLYPSLYSGDLSLPSWERGLKCVVSQCPIRNPRRSPRGSAG